MPVPTLSSSTDSPPPASPVPCRRPHKKKARHLAKAAAASSTTYVDLGAQLRRAAGAGKSRLLARLLHSGADPNEATSEGDTALMKACAGSMTAGKTGVIESLLASGADVNAANRGGETALMVAAKEGNMAAVEALLSAEADVRQEDRDCDTALSHATRQGSEEVVRALVVATRAAGCDVDHRNIKGLTSLLLASQNGRLGVARILVLEGGASCSIRDLDNFMTPLDWLMLGGHYLESEVAFLLPVSQKRNRYCQTKGVRTLTVYMSGATGGLTQNTVSSGRCSTPRLPKISPSLQTTLSQTCSMFDPPPDPPQNKKMLPPRPLPPSSSPSLNFNPKTENRFNCDLYQSTYLKKRNHYLHSNHRSEFYHEGSLKPILGGHLERLDQVTDKSKKEQRQGGGGGGGGGRGGGGGGGRGGGGEGVRGKSKFHRLPPI